MKKFLKHLWYISEKLVASAFFNDSVSFERKRKIMHTLKNEGKMITLKTYTFLCHSPKRQARFCNTLRFFKTMNLPSDFFKTDATN